MELTEMQIRKMRHMLGLDHSKRKKPYRNYYYTHSIDEDLEPLIKKGFARSHEASNQRDIIYHLTKNGVELILGHKIHQKTYDDL